MSNLVAWIGWAAGSFWSVELEAEDLTHMRGLQPHGQTWHSSAGLVIPLLAFDRWHFFWSERLSWPLLPCMCRRTKRWNWEKGHSCSLLQPHIVEAVPAQPRATLSSTPGPRDGSHACGSHSWREVKHFKPLLWLWKGIVNPQLASGFEYGVKSMQCLPVRHKRIKLPVGFFWSL